MIVLQKKMLQPYGQKDICSGDNVWGLDFYWNVCRQEFRQLKKILSRIFVVFFVDQVTKIVMHLSFAMSCWYRNVVEINQPFTYQLHWRVMSSCKFELFYHCLFLFQSQTTDVLEHLLPQNSPIRIYLWMKG